MTRHRTSVSHDPCSVPSQWVEFVLPLLLCCHFFTVCPLCCFRQHTVVQKWLSFAECSTLYCQLSDVCAPDICECGEDYMYINVVLELELKLRLLENLTPRAPLLNFILFQLLQSAPFCCLIIPWLTIVINCSNNCVKTCSGHLIQ